MIFSRFINTHRTVTSTAIEYVEISDAAFLGRISWSVYTCVTVRRTSHVARRTSLPVTNLSIVVDSALECIQASSSSLSPILSPSCTIYRYMRSTRMPGAVLTIPSVGRQFISVSAPALLHPADTRGKPASASKLSFLTLTVADRTTTTSIAIAHNAVSDVAFQDCVPAIMHNAPATAHI
ncbi:hypothetical protein PENSPDRAFT_319015 [Peniophora sp. CONT]|nr:hypothetical protein PENSPDRAFT_319015 [Peniophora sp. CONT]